MIAKVTNQCKSHWTVIEEPFNAVKLIESLS